MGLCGARLEEVGCERLPACFVASSSERARCLGTPSLWEGLRRSRWALSERGGRGGAAAEALQASGSTATSGSARQAAPDNYSDLYLIFLKSISVKKNPKLSRIVMFLDVSRGTDP